GTNLLDVEGVDSSGSHSPLQRRTFIRVVPPPKLFITSSGAGTYCLRLAGVPNATHRLQTATMIPSTNWASLVEVTTDSLGVAEYGDTPAARQLQRFYRVVCP